MASFSFSFSGDDIEGGGDEGMHGATGTPQGAASVPPPSETTASPAAAPSAFPVQGKPQLPPRRHDLREMLARLPSKIAYGVLRVALEEGDDKREDDSALPPQAAAAAQNWIRLPRRELWDVRVQLMAEDDRMGEGEGEGDVSIGLGTHDVKTGIYEGGFKSWESSIDLVKVLLRAGPGTAGPSPSVVAAQVLETGGAAHVIELGCGTALPSLALFQWVCSGSGAATPGRPGGSRPVAITVADYNPSVLYLVTLPNFLLAWALQQRAAGNPLLQQAVSIEGDHEDDHGGEDGGELELSDEVKDAFCAFLATSGITLSFLSGGWSPAFVDLLYANTGSTSTEHTTTLVLGAETIYSPFALASFSETLLAILRREHGGSSSRGSNNDATDMAIVGAKKLYFGVGGSLDDFARGMAEAGATVRELSEATEGVRRGVVQCVLE